MMSVLIKQASLWGSIVALIVLLIALVKQLIFFINFLMFILKAGVVLAFVALISLILIVIWRDYNKRKRDESSL